MRPTPTAELRLALGTVQLGVPYGIANTRGQPNETEATNIVEASFEGGVRFFDTAQAYGESERVLGRAFRQLGITRDVLVISKINGNIEHDEIEQSVRRSLKLLGIDKLWALLLHDEALLDAWDGSFGNVFRSLKQKNLTIHLGVSIYSPERAFQAIGLRGLDVLQLPANVFDRRMERAGVFDALKSAGKAAFIRSVYLQGLALLDLDKAPVFANEAVSTYASFCRQRNLERREFAVDYVRQMIDAPLVIGAETAEQARTNCRLLTKPRRCDLPFSDWDGRWPEDLFPLVNPSKWPRT